MILSMLELPFGLRAGQLVHVSEVEAGRACNCVCPSCGHPLVARKGVRKMHHFAHASDSECAHGVETALHLAAKQLLEAERCIRIPAVTLDFEYSHKRPWLIQAETLVRFDELRLEHRLGSITPDILVYAQDRPLMIEVVVTHAVDEFKLHKLKQLGISTLAITLTGFEREPTWAALRHEVIEATHSKRWLYNARSETIRQQLFARCESKTPIRDGALLYVDDCPIGARIINGKPAANVVADCLACDFCVRAGDDGTLLCAGKHRLATYADLKHALATSAK